MEHRAHHAEVAAGEARQEVALVQVVVDLAVGEVAEFVAVGEIVHRDDVGLAARVERLDDIAADEAGGTGNDDAHGCPRKGFRGA
ncbi:hypothetical protein D9M69_567720 [compost metagenome]